MKAWISTETALKQGCLRPSAWHVTLLLCGILSLLLVQQVQAQRMTKGLEHVRPRFGQQGTTVEVQLLGIAQALSEPRKLLFYQPGIEATDLAMGPAPKRQDLVHGGYVDACVTARFHIAPDCPPGQYAFRLLCARELSLVGTFHVTPFMVINEQDTPNDSLETAMKLVHPITVMGELGADGVDYYRIAAQQGQRLSFELQAVGIADQNYGDSEFDLALRVLDRSGKELAYNDDNAFHVQDPVISMQAPSTDDFWVEVRHSVYATRKVDYALHAGDYPRPTVAYPLGGEAGTELSFQCLGDAMGRYQASLALPTDQESIAFFDGGPSPISLRASPFANVLESGDLTPVPQLPVALNGVIEDARDVDTFMVQVKASDAWRVRVYAASLGSPIDPILIIRPLGTDGQPGEPEIEQDDASLTERDIFGTAYRGGGGRTAVLDPSVLWRPRQSGNYWIELADSSGAGSPEGVYRIEIEPIPNRFQTVLRSQSNDWVESMRTSGFAIPRGGRWTVNVTLQQGQFSSPKGAFDLMARGLPEGVELVSPRVPEGALLWPVQLIAHAQAPLGGSTFLLEARSSDTTISGDTFAPHAQQNIPFLNHSGGNALHHVQVDRYMVGVTDPAPFHVEVEAPSGPVARNSEIALRIKVHRERDFSGEVQFAVGYAPTGISSQPITTLPAHESEAFIKLSVGAATPKGAQPFVVVANSVHETLTPWLGTGHVQVSSPIITLDITEPYLELSSEPTSIRRGETQEFSWQIRSLTPFEGTATARLLGLPKGVQVIGDQPRLTTDAQSITFTLEADNQALLGLETGIRCEVIIQTHGTEIIQRAGQGSLRIDPALRAEHNAIP